MSDSEQATIPGAAMYMAGIVLTVTAVFVGLFLHWVAAMAGPGLGLFGIDAWMGAFFGLAMVLVGIWWWRSGRRRSGTTVRRVGKVLAVVTAAAAMLGGNHLLGASWSITCEENRPDVCFHLAGYHHANAEPEQARDAADTACRSGHIDACARLLGDDGSDEKQASICEIADELCASARRCEQDDERCDEFAEPVELPRPDQEQCSELTARCGSIESSQAHQQ